MDKINIQSNRGIYFVKFTDQIQKIVDTLAEKNITHLLIDKNICYFHSKLFKNVLKIARSVYVFNSVEKKKNLEEVQKYIEFLLTKKIQKNHKILVIGGALIQDIGSFTSHILFRGVDWIFIPTTLLAMADSCIGSKSGINVGNFKNQIGSFHHPSEIYIYPSFIKTLSKDDLLNGKGEIIKHILIKGGPVFSEIIENIEVLEKNMSSSQKIVYESLLIKKDIIEKDEYEEKEIRKILNYGHTFGHALEGYTKNKISHGIAVLIGMDMANYISVKRRLMSKEEFSKLHEIIKKYIPYRKIPVKNIGLYLKFLSKDKKAVGQSINAILCKGLGKIIISKIKLDRKLALEITEYCKLYNQER